MGQLTLPKSGTVYVDTNAIVYRVERIEPYLSASAPFVRSTRPGVRHRRNERIDLARSPGQTAEGR
jgi:hypothetical protein